MPIEIIAREKSITVSSVGDQLKKGLEYYTRPFVRGDRSKSGHGLGLNIVQKVLKKYGYTLKYDHIDGKNSFTVEFFA